MTVKITQQIMQTAPAEYVVTMTIGECQPYEETYTRSNAVFPAYRTLIQALRDIEDCDAHVTTESAPLVREFNASRVNPNSSLLRQLVETSARQGITLTIDAVATE